VARYAGRKRKKLEEKSELIIEYYVEAARQPYDSNKGLELSPYF
jgi:hypothetical protein